MRTGSLIAGLVCILFALLDAFQTIILPRRPQGRFRITRLFYIVTWRPWAFVALRISKRRVRDTFYSIYGPLSLLMLLAVWAVVLVVGYGLVYYALGTPFLDPMLPDSAGHGLNALRTDLYVSGTTIFTLGLGDVVPRTLAARALLIVEAGNGLGFVAVVIGYLPVLYGAFSRREVSIALLDGRAGSPPTATEMIRRHSFEGGTEALILLLEEWERWSAELLESHISYPLLCYFRSQHDNQSWLTSLTCILDTCSLLIASIRGNSARQAQLTFAMARHAIADLTQVFNQVPVAPPVDRLEAETFAKMCSQLAESGVNLCGDRESAARLNTMRGLYEGHAQALSVYLALPLQPWVADRPVKSNWQTVSQVRSEAEAVLGLPVRGAMAERSFDGGTGGSRTGGGGAFGSGSSAQHDEDDEHHH